MTQVLVVARTPSVRDLLRQAVQESGLSAETTENYESAAAAIEKEPPTLVLAENPPDDQTMEQLHKTLRARAPVTPLIVFLTELNSAVALKRMTEGAYDCLCPPLAPGDFLASAKRAVSRVGRRLLTSEPITPSTWWRQPVTYISLGVLVFVGLLGLGLFGLWAPPFQIYKLATEHPVGLAGDKNSLWVADWSQQNLTALRVQGDYVSILEVHRMPDSQPVAVALAPYYIYTASADGRLRRHRREEPATVVASVPAPDAVPSGLAWDGEALWSCDSDTGKIYEYDARLGVKNSFASPAAKPVGLAWHKGALWVADGQNNVLWKMTRTGAEWKKEGPFPLDVFAHNRELKLSGFSIWKDKAWIVSESGGVLVQHRFREK
ncbi:MAG: hypothetical protein HY548_07550 [Elusimicrobia bacterium]|nr:hypothetical protein [Elusimicrobiota bacterium]